MQMTADDLERVLRGDELPSGQIALLKAVYESDGDSISLSEIFTAARWGDVGGFNGVLRSFATRVNQTEGFADDSPGYEAFFERITTGGQGELRLREEARAAIEAVPELLEAMDHSYSELFDDGVSIRPAPAADRTVNEPSDGDALPQSDVQSEPETPPKSESPDAEAPGAETPPSRPTEWRPESTEQHLLERYVRRVGGTLIVDLSDLSADLGDWDDAPADVHIDGLRLPGGDGPEIRRAETLTSEQLREVVGGRHVETVAAARQLDPEAIGSALAGADLICRALGPSTIEPVVVCEGGDSSLAWVARRRGLRLAVLDGSPPG